MIGKRSSNMNIVRILQKSDLFHWIFITALETVRRYRYPVSQYAQIL